MGGRPHAEGKPAQRPERAGQGRQAPRAGHERDPRGRPRATAAPPPSPRPDATARRVLQAPAPRRQARRRSPLAVAVVLACLLLTGSAFAGAAVCEREMAAAAARHGVPLGVLYAVGLTETGRGGRLHPNAMNIEGEPYFAASRRAALERLRREIARGRRLIDVGCMQINQHWHRHRFRSHAHMLDPAANVDYAARFLKELRMREGSWTMAVARYHAGPRNDPAQKRYVCAVIEKLVATGFGAWTPEARAFCR